MSPLEFLDDHAYRMVLFGTMTIGWSPGRLAASPTCASSP